MIEWESAVKPFKKVYTGRTESMSWGTKRFFQWIDGNQKPISMTGGWELIYETPEQEAEHQRCKAGKESAVTQ